MDCECIKKKKKKENRLTDAKETQTFQHNSGMNPHKKKLMTNFDKLSGGRKVFLRMTDCLPK